MTRRAEDPRQHLERIRSERLVFARAASHDLLAPARQISTFGELARESLRDGKMAEAEEFLDFISRAARRMQKMALALSEYLRVDEEGIRVRSLCLEALVDEAFEAAREAAPSGTSLVRDRLPNVVADPAMLRCVLGHLLSNAVNYRRDVPLEVHVRGGAGDEGCWVSVADNGMGIEPELVERAFDPLRRLVRAGHVEGSGLGLSTCRRIAVAHQGTLEVESVPGRGSTFTFRWPPLAAQEC